MNKVFYLSLFVFLAVLLGYSTHDAHASTFVLNQTFCESNGGIWDSGTNTCTISSLTIDSGDIFELNSGTTLNVTSSLTIAGNVTLNTGNIINSGTFSNSFNVTINAGSITNSGTITNDANAIINNNAGGIITNTASGTIDNSGSITNNPTSSIANAGSINNNSEGIINNNSATLNNSGSITNTGTINNNGAVITNIGSLTNNSGGKITNNGSGQITNSGTMTNSGTIKNNSGIIHNSNTFTNTATGLISNPSVLENECNATFTDDGKITGNALVQISCDTTPPVITPGISGTLGDNGWYTSDVTVNWSVTDSESLVSSQSGCDPTTINTDTMGQTLTCTATSSGGTASQSVTIMRDTVNPLTAIDGATDGNNAPVTDGGKTNSNSINVAFTATDTTSGVAGSTCNLDGGSFSACSSPASYSSLTDGSHTVQIRSTDSAGNQETTATFTWTVDTTKPTANPQLVSTDMNTPASITLTGSDSDGDLVTFAVGTGPSHGALSGVSPNLTYTPDSNYHGPDSFTFTASDGINTGDPATVSITVVDNIAPTADPQSVSTNENTPLAITLTGSDSDGDLLTFSVGTGPSNGVLTGASPNLTYTPNSGFSGTDSFTFTSNDGTNTSSPATVSITVNPILPTSVTLNPDKDSFLRKGATNTNEGANPLLGVTSVKANLKRTLISFGLSQYSGQHVQNAKLRLFVDVQGNNWGKNGQTIEAHKLNISWTEGNGYNLNAFGGSRGTGSGVTWNCAIDGNITNKIPNCNRPGWNGGIFNSTPSAIVTIKNGMLLQWIEFDVTSDVNSMLAGSPNNGWIIKKTDEISPGTIAFLSKESDPITQPQLVLNFD